MVVPAIIRIFAPTYLSQTHNETLSRQKVACPYCRLLHDYIHAYGLFGRSEENRCRFPMLHGRVA
jgi:hypothetical protein